MAFRAMRKAAPGSECSSLVSPGLGSPFAMTSILLSSFLMVSVLRSRRKTFVETVAPASRQIRATARSRAAPLDLKVPDRGQAARWSPKGSKGCWHRHLAGVCGRGRRRRLSKRARKWAGSKTSSGDVGKVVKMVAAKGPRVEHGSGRWVKAWCDFCGICFVDGG